MFEDRLTDVQAVRAVALEKAIDSFNSLPQQGRLDTIVYRAEKFEKYLETGTSESVPTLIEEGQ